MFAMESDGPLSSDCAAMYMHLYSQKYNESETTKNLFNICVCFVDLIRFYILINRYRECEF